jgi:penicillin-binding protein 1A
VLTKQQILEIYLNQIFLGRNAYGVQAASRAYFDKDVDQLTLPEMAYLAILPKAPNNYDPDTRGQRAVARRNWVLAEMEKNGKISAEQRAEAQAAPLGTVRGPQNSVRNIGGYFMEELRRELIARYGEGTEKGPERSLYRRPLDPLVDRRPQADRRRDGASRRPDALRRQSTAGTIPASPSTSAATGAALSPGRRSEWAIRTGRRRWCFRSRAGSPGSASSTAARATSPPRAAMPKRGTGTAAFDFLRPGTVIAVKRSGADWALEDDPVDQRRNGGRGGRLGPDPRHAGRLGPAPRRLSTAPPRRCASPARPSSRSSIRPRSTTASPPPRSSSTGRSASGRARASATNASATSPAAMPGRRRCAGASSSRAT